MAEATKENIECVAADRSGRDSVSLHGRVLSLDLRQSRFGFVVLHGRHVMDWGRRRFDVAAKRDSQGVGAKVATILDLYAPEIVLILRHRDRPFRSDDLRAAVARVTAEATRNAVPCRLVTAEEVRRFFARHGATTKYTIATKVAEWLPELAWRLPAARKLWQREQYNMSIFDAAACALVFCR